MIVAGIGMRRSAEADEIVTLVETALARAALPSGSLDKLATLPALAALPALVEAARRLGVETLAVDRTGLDDAAPRVRTLSDRALAAHGVGSVAEAAALGGAGRGASLVLQRIASAAVTCALARADATP